MKGLRDIRDSVYLILLGAVFLALSPLLMAGAFLYSIAESRFE